MEGKLVLILVKGLIGSSLEVRNRNASIDFACICKAVS